MPEETPGLSSFQSWSNSAVGDTKFEAELLEEELELPELLPDPEELPDMLLLELVLVELEELPDMLP